MAFIFSGQNSIELLEYINGKKVVAFINEQDIDASADWHPFDDSPPISFTKLTSAVKEYINANEDLREAELSEIELRPIPHRKEKWHYVVTLKKKVDNEIHNEYLVVLMNGKVIPAFREPDSIK
jgi:hypothetical protein